MATVVAASTFSGVGSVENVNTGLQYPAGTNITPNHVSITITSDTYQGTAAKPAGVNIHATNANDNIIDVTLEGNAQLAWIGAAFLIQ